MKCKTKGTKISNEINRNYCDIEKQILPKVVVHVKDEIHLFLFFFNF